VLFERQVLHLDRVVTNLRRKNIVTTRAALIRQLIDGFIERRFELPQLVPPQSGES
jgi:hypothetical protein